MAKKKIRVSPMKGRRISLEDRGPDAKKLGRKFKYGNSEGERFVVTLMLRKGDMVKLLDIKKNRGKKKAEVIANLIETEIGKGE